MTNWCSNEITIEGDPAELKKLVRFVKSKESDFDFNKIAPYPEEYARLDAEVKALADSGVSPDKLPVSGYASGGFEWCFANWGTKWNAQEASVSLDGNTIYVDFESAWGPALTVIAKLAEMYPNLLTIHEYKNEGESRWMYVVYKNGEEVDEGKGRYKKGSDIATYDDKANNTFVLEGYSDYHIKNSDGIIILKKYTGKEKDLILPDCINTIDEKAFYQSPFLVSVAVPDSVKKIGNSAFSGCKNLSKVDLPEHLKEIGNEAFLECSKLTSISIPDSVKVLGKQAFRLCKGIKSIVLPNCLEVIENELFSGCINIITVNIPESVKRIGAWAFYSCASISSIVIPNKVEKVGKGAFENCHKIKSVTFPQDSLLEIGEEAFSNCENLDSIIIPDSVKKTGPGAFNECEALQNVMISKKIQKIEDYLFSGCDLLNVDIPESVKHIGEGAFSGCERLVSIIIPHHVKTIDMEAFSSCTGLTKVEISNNIESIDDSTFEGCPNLTIFAPQGSYAIEYAKKNEIKYVES